MTSPSLTPSQRLERAAISSLSWCPSCMNAAPPHPPLPLFFTSPHHYISSFEPFLYTEVRASISNSFQEASTAGRGWRSGLVECSHANDGWVSILLKPTEASFGLNNDSHGKVEAVREGSVVIIEQDEDNGYVDEDEDSGCSEGEIKPMTNRQPTATPRSHDHNRYHSKPSKSYYSSSKAPIRFTGIVRKSTWGGVNDNLSVHLFPVCPLHERAHLQRIRYCQTPAATTSNHQGELRAECIEGLSSLTTFPSSTWWVVPIGPLVTAQREVEALSLLINAPTATTSSSASSSHSTNTCTRGMSEELLDAILHPDRVSKTKELLRQWPQDAVGRRQDKPYLDWLSSRYDHPQMQAIEACAAHYILDPPPSSSLVPHRADTLLPSGDISNNPKPATSQKKGLPITLIQGPPGTGEQIESNSCPTSLSFSQILLFPTRRQDTHSAGYPQHMASCAVHSSSGGVEGGG